MQADYTSVCLPEGGQQSSHSRKLLRGKLLKGKRPKAIKQILRTELLWINLGTEV